VKSIASISWSAAYSLSESGAMHLTTQRLGCVRSQCYSAQLSIRNYPLSVRVLVGHDEWIGLEPVVNARLGQASFAFPFEVDSRKFRTAR
jgi:hypothetical protein